MSVETNKKTRASSRKEDSSRGEILKPIKLLSPKLARNSSVMSALRKRKTIREISTRKISLQLLSNILWAANGVNRRIGPFGLPGRTAASASNSQEIDIYAALAEGLYFYDAPRHMLTPVVSGDLRPLAIGKGQTGFGDTAPLRLIYVADAHRLSHTAGFQEPGLQNPEVQKSYYYVDTGMIAANVYLMAASCGLASWFHNCDRTDLAKHLPLREEQRILFGQSVGYPER